METKPFYCLRHQNQQQKQQTPSKRKKELKSLDFIQRHIVGIEKKKSKRKKYTMRRSSQNNKMEKIHLKFYNIHWFSTLLFVVLLLFLLSSWIYFPSALFDLQYNIICHHLVYHKINKENNEIDTLSFVLFVFSVVLLQTGRA